MKKKGQGQVSQSLVLLQVVVVLVLGQVLLWGLMVLVLEEEGWPGMLMSWPEICHPPG